MSFKTILTLVSVLIIVSLMFFYFIPLNTINFTTNSGNSNFSLIQGSQQMQYYSNMRFPSSQISYKISDCILQKENDMRYAFDVMENLTILRFNPVSDNEEISVTCLEKNKHENGMFIAGEGGPTGIIAAGNFNVISGGEILLIMNSECEKPNVAIHELLHVLGFRHSSNPNNVMYNVTGCDETVSDDMIQLIDKLYSAPSYPDLIFENVSAFLKGRYLNVNMTVINAGLNDAGESKIIIYADNSSVDEINVDSLKIGQGEFISLKNIWISKLNVNELNLRIESSFNEINKENNNIKLEIKK